MNYPGWYKDPVTRQWHYFGPRDTVPARYSNTNDSNGSSNG